MFEALAVIHAAILSVKNAATVAVGLFLTGVFASATDMTLFTNPRHIAVLFALLGVFWRWHKFRLSRHSVTSEIAISAVFAYLLGDTQIVGVGALFQNLRPESIPMLNGLFVGVFNVTIVSGVSDFVKAYAARKK